MAKKVRLEFAYEDGLADALKLIFEAMIGSTISIPDITIITRMTEHDISEGPTKMIEATEIIHEKITSNTVTTNGLCDEQ